MNVENAPRVLVSGAGIAGLALALELVRCGVPVVVVERADGPRPGGQAVDLRGASREVAARMGLLDAIDRYRLHERGLAYVDAHGRVFGRMSMEDFDGKGAVAEIEIARDDLDRVLRDALSDAAAATQGLLDLRYGDRITAIRPDARGADVEFAASAPERFDLVVGADGVHSATRRMVFGPEEAFATPLGGYAAYFTMPTPTGVEPEWFTMRFVPGATFGIRPDRDPSTSKAMLTLRVDRDPSLRGAREAQEALVRRLLDRAGWRAPEILAALPAAPDFYFDELVRIDVPDPVRGRVVLLGDAASCGSPLTGMGTATALIGAHLLAVRIADASERGADPTALDEGLQAYAAGIASFAEAGKRIMGGGIARMVPRTRLAALLSRASMSVMLSRPLRPLVKRMFDAGPADPALPW